MRRIGAFLIAIVMMASAFVCLIPVSAEGENANNGNFAAGLVWNKTTGTPTVTQTETGAVMTNLANSWDSAGVDILPAIKNALGDGDSVTLTLSVDMKATMKTGRENSVLSARPLIRGTNARPGVTGAAWDNAYAAAIGDVPTLFAMYDGNIMGYMGEIISMSHGKWVNHTLVMELTRSQIECNLLREWIFCIDTLSGMNLSFVQSIEFRSLTLELFSDSVDEDDELNNNDYLTTNYPAEVWSPVEITLKSTKSYGNPYMATEIDAVFTHADGTTIKVPGFWKGGDTWAVRFSPTKTGKWTYAITCADESNDGLFKSGIIQARKASKETDVAQHGFVTTQRDTHYYTYADGTPFFWLGDTNWQAFTNVSTTICNYPGCDCGNQFKHIVDDRVEKGFTVYQTYFVPEAGNGEKTLWLGSGYTYPDTTVFNGKVDEMFEYLHEEGMVIALGLGCHSSTMSRMNLEDLLRFTRYVVARYACYSVVWISGQEITDNSSSVTSGYSAFDCYMEASALIEELDGYRHPNSAHMFPMNIEDERAVRLDNAEWHDSWTLQNGHSKIQPVDFYKGYYEARITGVIKPFIESEANYEDINCNGFTGYDLNRISAWYAMLSGSAGFTYGVTGIWANSFSTSDYTGWLGDTSSFSYDPWYAGLDKPGSFEVSYMKEFFTDTRAWYDLIPCFDNSDAGNFLRRGNSAMAATADASVIVAYFYNDRNTASGTIRILDETKTYDVYWFNPRTGKYIPIAKGVQSDNGEYAVPDRPDSDDWVVLLTAVGLGTHYEENLLVDLNPSYEQVAPTGQPATPVSVEALGGITYEGTPKDAQVMTDHTAWLYDNDPSTVWTPFVNRSTQTFLFDFGTAQTLTHLTITPAAGTIIPTFRVSGSNDGEHWTILVDTSIRKTPNPGAGSEPLQGTYRYVKILLLNPPSLSLGANQLNTLEYEAMYNAMTNNSYSVTRIADVVVYSAGEGTPTPDMLVDSSLVAPPVDDPEETTEEETEIETEPETEVETETETETEAETEVETETETETEIETETEVETETEIETETEMETETEPEPSAEETTVKPMAPVPSPSESETGEGDKINIQERGCRSIISVATVLVLSVVTTALCLKKKEE